MAGHWRLPPLPTSPTGGEVPLPVWGAKLPRPLARHIPLDGGCQEGVWFWQGMPL